MKNARLLSGLASALILVLGFSTGCASVQQPFMGATRELTNGEAELLRAMSDRMKANRPAIQSSLNDLADISRSAIEDTDSLALNVSKAKLLESMKSPWSRPSSSLVETQRAVALYHLYALAEAEQEVAEARLEQRLASSRAVLDQYDQLISLTGKTIEAQKLVLEHLNRSEAAMARSFIANLLTEVEAFRADIAKADDPSLQRFAEKVAKAEEQLGGQRENIEKALDFILER